MAKKDIEDAEVVEESVSKRGKKDKNVPIPQLIDSIAGELHLPPVDISRGKFSANTFPTGSLTSDLILGGGHGIGRWITILGPSGSGKSTFQYLNQATLQRMSVPMMVFDHEGCLVPSSLVFTEGGIKTLGEVIGLKFNQQKDVGFNPLGTKVYSVDGFRTAEKWFNAGKKKTRKITTKRGFSIEGSYQHKVLVLRKGFKLKWVRLDSLVFGDRVAIQHGMNAWSKTDTLPAFDYKPTAVSNEGFIPKRMTDKLARIIGDLVSDGSINSCKIYTNGSSHGARVSFSSTDKKTVLNYTSLIEEVFKVAPITREEPYIRNDMSVGVNFVADVNSAKLVAFFNQLGLAEGPSSNRRVPWSILSASKSAVLQFLSGLVDGDGSVGDASISIDSVSKELLNVVHVLLLNLGIVGSLHPYSRETKEGSKRYWRVLVSGRNAVLFARMLTSVNQSKAEALQVLSEKDTSLNLEQVPYLKSRLSALKGSAEGGPGRFLRNGKFIRASLGPQNPCKEFSVSYLAKHGALIKDGLAKLGKSKLLETLAQVEALNVVWDEIVSIKDCKSKHVYDLSIPEETPFLKHAYVSNGFVSHNSIDPVYMRNIGVKLLKSAGYYNIPADVGEHTYRFIRRVLKRMPDVERKELNVPTMVFFIDSLKAMVPEIIDEDDEKNPMGLAARMHRHYMPAVRSLLRRKGATVIATNQISQNIGGYGAPETEPGGQAVQFYPDIRLRIGRHSPKLSTPGCPASAKIHSGGYIKEDSIWPGGGHDKMVWTTIRTLKNRQFAPYQEGELRLNLGRGLDPIMDAYSFLEMTGQVEMHKGQKPELKVDGWKNKNGKALEWFSFGQIVASAEFRDYLRGQLKDNTAFDLYFQVTVGRSGSSEFKHGRDPLALPAEEKIKKNKKNKKGKK